MADMTMAACVGLKERRGNDLYREVYAERGRRGPGARNIEVKNGIGVKNIKYFDELTCFSTKEYY